MASDKGLIGEVVRALDCDKLGGDPDCVEETVRDVLRAVERAGFAVVRKRGGNGGRRQSGGAPRS